jgi:hypothetical protein
VPIRQTQWKKTNAVAVIKRIHPIPAVAEFTIAVAPPRIVIKR